MHSPWTLWRYILFEFWRLALLTAAVLVTVLSFTAAVKFLADGRLGPLDTLRFMAYAVPPMLQYALPFAGGFAATLAYHRMAADNELVACHAGGMSHRRVLVPAVMSGLVLAAALALLSDRVIPRYLRSMDEMIARDAARLMVASINRGEAVTFDNSKLVYADSCTVLEPKPESGADNLLYVRGLLLVQLDKRGDVQSEGSAPEAYIWFYRDATPGAGVEMPADADPGVRFGTDAVTKVVMDPKGFVGRKRGEVVTQQESVEFRYLVRQPFRDDPKFFGFADLERLRSTPERIGQVESKRRVLAALLGERYTTDALGAALASTGHVELLDSAGGAYTLSASRLVRYDNDLRYWVLEPIASGPEKGSYLIDKTGADGRPQRYRAANVQLRTSVDASRASGLVALNLKLTNAVAVARSGVGPGAREGDDAAGQVRGRDLFGLVLASDPVKGLTSMSARDLLAAADARIRATSGDGYVQPARDELAKRVQDLMREITSKQHERVAVCVACLVMVLTGGVMAMRLRDALPLTVYLWSFFPALGAVITISAGQQLVHEVGSLGLLLLWGGVVAQATYTFVQFRELARR
jgi:lipopolysaccharide export LptBFGC system permease protein LptF